MQNKNVLSFSEYCAMNEQYKSLSEFRHPNIIEIIRMSKDDSIKYAAKHILTIIRQWISQTGIISGDQVTLLSDSSAPANAQPFKVGNTISRLMEVLSKWSNAANKYDMLPDSNKSKITKEELISNIDKSIDVVNMFFDAIEEYLVDDESKSKLEEYRQELRNIDYDY